MSRFAHPRTVGGGPYIRRYCKRKRERETAGGRWRHPYRLKTSSSAQISSHTRHKRGNIDTNKKRCSSWQCRSFASESKKAHIARICAQALPSAQRECQSEFIRRAKASSFGVPER
eukprot:2417762-Pleurochrysis_carterae.AAC.1